jgi:hypothetical protein
MILKWIDGMSGSNLVKRPIYVSVYRCAAEYVLKNPWQCRADIFSRDKAPKRSIVQRVLEVNHNILIKWNFIQEASNAFLLMLWQLSFPSPSECWNIGTCLRWSLSHLVQMSIAPWREFPCEFLNRQCCVIERE